MQDPADFVLANIKLILGSEINYFTGVLKILNTAIFYEFNLGCGRLNQGIDENVL